ncbi:sigma-70 family RNA polymerase sigma factor [Thermocrispum municipale]|uniref:sigma-70 family RNA polymerase sigma factor n=1 Tax=Thermocrispum municipale TaxID=37926 RepID=UPI00040840B9|nr:sigma-70 family RNA polymerase sigma factor [Thermocrispum municipale]
MTTAPTGGAEAQGPSDAELIDAVRKGTISAYGTLYERHVQAAYNLARQLARSSAEADDLVAEAFAKVLDTLRAGKGPDSAFRAYLLTSLRHAAYDKTRKDKRVDLNEDMSEVSGALGAALTVPFSDTAVAGLERTMAARAFARLPERWQAVLWHTEIEQQSPAEVAPLMGLTPNGVSALAYRAREGLRQAYLQVHLAETTADRCRATADKLGAWTRDGLSKRERAQVENHLDTCDQCRALAAELADVNGAIRAVVAPLVLGGAALGYLALAGAAKGSAATAGAAAASAGAAAAAGSSSGGAASAGAAAPRQLLGVGASGAAVVAAVAVALASGGPDPLPAAQPQPQAQPPAAESPQQPPAAKPAPPNEPQQQPPPAGQPESPPASDSPAPPAPRPEPPPPEQPLPADISVAPPGGSLELTPGGGPTDLPITVRNDGGRKSKPVIVTLNLPRGVTAVDPAGGGGSTAGRTASVPLASAPQAAAKNQYVKCPGGSGQVTCRTPDGLEPREAATLVFRLVADSSVRNGQITGTVSSGSTTTLNIRIPVRVEAKDGVTLDARAHGWHLAAEVTNSGETTKHATVTINRPMLINDWSGLDFTCLSGPSATTCSSKRALEPDEKAYLLVPLSHGGFPNNVTVAARIGSASASRTVRPWCFFGCWPGLLPDAVPQSEAPSTDPVESSTPESVEPSESHQPAPPSSSTESPSSTPEGPSSGTPSQSSSPPSTTTTTKKPPAWERPNPKPRSNRDAERMFRDWLHW